MTHNEIAELQKQRREDHIDIRLAIRLFGFEWWKSSSTGNRALFGAKRPDWVLERATGTEGCCGDGWSSSVPLWSTDPTAWLDIIPALAKMGLSVTLDMIPHDGYASYLCQIRRDDPYKGDDETLGEGGGRSWAAAVTEAALKVTEEIEIPF
jgi:hypothetical protein